MFHKQPMEDFEKKAALKNFAIFIPMLEFLFNKVVPTKDI